MTKKKKNFFEKGAHFAFYGIMASIDVKSITRLAIPATYWEDKEIQSEPWFKIRDKMYYEVKVLEHKQDWDNRKLIFKNELLDTGEKLWFNEKSILDYDYDKKPSDAVLVSEYKRESETEEDDDVLTKHVKKTKVPKKPRRTQSTGVW